MPKVTSSQSNLTTGEISPKCLGRYDHAKYNNAVKRMENWLINQLGGGFYRPGTRYVAETVDSTKASRLIPFQYSADQDYVVEVGDLYMKFFENDADTISKTITPTKFLSNFNGVDGSFEVQDTGNTGYIVTQVGTATLSTAQKKMGYCSLLLDGDSDYVTVPDSADWDFGAGDFTIDFCVRLNTTGFQAFCGHRTDTNNRWNLHYNNAVNKLGFNVLSGGATVFLTYGSWIPSADTWYHIALVRSGTGASETKMYVDGVYLGNTLDGGAWNYTMPNPTGTLSIGAELEGVNYTNGWIDELRISKSIARWTANFTPETTAYSSDANTVLLLHMESHDISSTTPKIPDFKGTAQLDTAVGKFKYGTASLLLDGNSDWVECADSADWYFGTDAFTVRGWFMFAGIGAQQNICGQYEDANNYWFMEITAANKLQMKFVDDGTTMGDYITVDAIAGLAINTYYHFAFVRSGSHAYIFVDGASKALTTNTAFVSKDVGNIAGKLKIGAYGADAGEGRFYNGWMDDFQIDQGYARYISDFTVPVAEATSGTVTTSTIVTDYLEADIFDLHYAQANDVMYITHPDYPPAKLSRTDATTFSIADVSFVRGPFLDTNITAITITPTADAGATTLDSSAGDIFHFEAGVAAADQKLVGSLFRVKDGVVKISTVVSATQATGDVQAEPDGTAGDLNTGPGATTDWAEGAFSYYRGFPATCVFHEQRLYYGNTEHEPQKFWGSYIAAYDSFDAGAAADDDAVMFEISTEQRNAIQWMSSGKSEMVIGTNGGIFSASTGSETEPITPTNILVTRSTNYGATNLLPQRISSFLYYIQRDLNKVRELAYSFEIDAQKATDMTLLAEHILIDGDGAVDIAHQQSPNDRIWVVRNDGQMSVLTRNPEQDVMGWVRIAAGYDATGPGKFESVCVIPKQNADDQVWAIVKRNINGTDTRFVEYFTVENFDEDWDAVQVDCSLTLDTPITISGVTTASPGVVTAVTHGLTTNDYVKINGVVSILDGEVNAMVDGEYIVVVLGPDTFSLKDTDGNAIDTTLLGTYVSGGEVRKMVTSISGLDHLTGETVYVQTDAYLPDTETYTVVAGAITLSNRAAVVHAGLRYKGTLQLLKLSDGNPKGTGQTQDRRIYKGTLRLHRTQGLNIGRTLTTLDPLNYNDEDDEDALFTGDMPKVFQTTWSRGDEIIIQQDKPLPAQILSIIMESEVN